MKGKTISITIPEPLLNAFDVEAKKLKTSRSKIITNILINEFKGKTVQNIHETELICKESKQVKGIEI